MEQKDICASSGITTIALTTTFYPIIRMTEAFYIAAECLKDSDPQRAIALLNEVRKVLSQSGQLSFAHQLECVRHPDRNLEGIPQGVCR